MKPVANFVVSAAVVVYSVFAGIFILAVAAVTGTVKFLNKGLDPHPPR